MEIIKRVQAPTPQFFKKFRTIGLVLAAIGGVVVTAPVALPTIVLSIEGYVAVAGGVSAISQLTVDDSKTNMDHDGS